MFRATHFVILFAVFMCAYGAPAAPLDAKPEEGARLPGPIAKQPAVTGVAPDAVEPKGDLKTDATTYLAYSSYYNGLRYSPYNYGLDWAGRSLYNPSIYRTPYSWSPYNVWY